MQLNTIPEAIEEIKNGKMIIVVDDENRENEGDLVMSAQMITPEAVNFMARFGRGLICTPITKEISQELDIPIMINNGKEPMGTAFTVSVDASHGITTGISAHDRAKTIELLSSPTSNKNDFVRPGHIFPLIAKGGGVLARDGHTEAAVDLAKLAGHRPVGVICEILNDDGSCARLNDLMIFAKEFDLKIISIEDLIKYLKNTQE